MAQANHLFGTSDDGFQLSTPQQRLPFHRENSSTPQITQDQLTGVEDSVEDDENDLGKQRGEFGLGLDEIPKSSSMSRISRVPVGSRESMGSALAGSISPLTPSSRLSQTTTAQNTPGDYLNSKSVAWANLSKSELLSSIPQQHEASSDTANLLHSHPAGSCPTRGDVLRGRWSWFSVTILALASYTTAFSAIFLVIAIVRPRWGERVGTPGHLSYASATLLSALFAKTIEISFATVFVALLGQVLSRRAFASSINNGGISIAEMNMRFWIMQPGTLVTNWMGVRYALTTILGLVALLAALAATFYTTAAEALVAPKLKMGPWEQRTLAGKVAASYANSPYLLQQCESPIPLTEDPYNKGPACLGIDFAGQSFHNFKTYLSTWTDDVDRGNLTEGATLFSHRPSPVALMYDNTTVSGAWLNFGNITEDSQKFGRLVLNVTMAMPHANIFSAVRDPINGILQPDDLQGNGEYVVRAAVPAPTLNVICAGISTEEANATFIGNATVIPPDWPKAGVLEDVFDFALLGETPPLFGKLPHDYNTIVNVSKNWGPPSVYLLAGPPDPAYFSSDDGYILCGMKSMQYSDCTTKYHVAQSGGQLSVHCGKDPENTMPYSKYQTKAPTGGLWEKNWKDVGSSWIMSVSLSQGITDGNASIARILTQMIPPYFEGVDTTLTTSTPTIGEGLSVLAGTTLLMSSEDAPFIHYWNYSDSVSVLEDPQLQYFEAQLQYVDYASGGSQGWQGLFYCVLVAVFLLNCFALAHLTWNFVIYGQVTDFTEPQNLFALAINSPPSRVLEGTCGGGPNGNVLAKKWAVNMQHAPSGNPNDHPHFFVQYQDEREESSPLLNRQKTGNTFGSRIQSWRDQLSPSISSHQLLPNKKKRPERRPRSVFETGVRESPAVEQYRHLAGENE